VLCNAQQATHRGGRTSVGFVVADNTVSVSVADDGVGMTSEVVARAFDPYFSAWESFETAGIGLCIAQAAVSSFGGSLHLASDGPGRGAECIMALPLER
jgi:C4-dicarboxylate-specific signal transduction histidine kinase